MERTSEKAAIAYSMQWNQWEDYKILVYEFAYIDWGFYLDRVILM